MKNDKIIPGTILVLTGVVFLLDNFNIIQFHWMNLLHLWPVFLVIGGISLVFAGNRSPLAAILKIAVVIAGFALLAFGNFGERYHYWPGVFMHFNNNDSDNDNDDDRDSSSAEKGVVKIEGNSIFKQDYTAGAKFARLNINGGGTTYNLSDTTNELFKAETKEFYGKYEFSHSKDDSVYVINLQMKNNKSFHFDQGDKDKSNMATIKLNPAPVWDINVETGATDLNFDLSKFKVKNITLKGGAASFDVKLGNPLAVTDVEVATGVSEVTINVPKTAACKITSNSGLSSNEFEGFNKKDDNNYETEGFGAAKTKINIHMSGGVSDFRVNRY